MRRARSNAFNLLGDATIHGGGGGVVVVVVVVVVVERERERERRNLQLSTRRSLQGDSNFLKPGVQ
jgi:hypothetical protein